MLIATNYRHYEYTISNSSGLVQAITPSKVGGIRKIINETTMDIMYYTSSYFRNEVRMLKISIKTLFTLNVNTF